MRTTNRNPPFSSWSKMWGGSRAISRAARAEIARDDLALPGHAPDPDPRPCRVLLGPRDGAPGPVRDDRRRTDHLRRRARGPARLHEPTHERAVRREGRVDAAHAEIAPHAQRDDGTALVAGRSGEPHVRRRRGAGPAGPAAGRARRRPPRPSGPRRLRPGRPRSARGARSDHAHRTRGSRAPSAREPPEMASAARERAPNGDVLRPSGAIVVRLPSRDSRPGSLRSPVSS